MYTVATAVVESQVVIVVFGANSNINISSGSLGIVATYHFSHEHHILMYTNMIPTVRTYVNSNLHIYL